MVNTYLGNGISILKRLLNMLIIIFIKLYAITMYMILLLKVYVQLHFKSFVM